MAESQREICAVFTNQDWYEMPRELIAAIMTNSTFKYFSNQKLEFRNIFALIGDR